MSTEKNNLEISERMVKLETDIGYIKQSIDNTNEKLDNFINSVDKKYASKDIESTVEKHDNAINNLNITIAKWIGGAIVVSSVLTWVTALLII